jgi:hypothetical protein
MESGMKSEMGMEMGMEEKGWRETGRERMSEGGQ